MGAVNGRSLRLSGELADGTVLSVLSSPAYREWARGRIREGMEVAGRDGNHRVATSALYSVDHDSGRAKQAAREAVAFFLAAEFESALARVPGVAEEASALLAGGGAAHLAKEMPDEWISEQAKTERERIVRSGCATGRELANIRFCARCTPPSPDQIPSAFSVPIWVKDAVVVVLRRFRTGKSAPGSDIGHCRELVETIDAYLSRHPAMGWDGVEAAPRMARSAVAYCRRRGRRMSRRSLPGEQGALAGRRRRGRTV